MDSQFRLLEISLPFVRDEARGMGYNVLKLPDPPEDAALVMGDCLHNLRSVLDYTIWQAVLFAGTLDPDRRTMFPICQSEEEFANQLKRSRLRGLPDAAVAVVKSLQPIGQPRNPLALLDELCNSDKHRDLHVVVSVASDMELYYLRNGELVMQSLIAGEEVENGAIFGGVAMPLAMLPPGLEIEVIGRAAGFIGLRTGQTERNESPPVVLTLEEIRDHLMQKVLPALEPFIGQ